jgi:hypothetical protein
LEVPELIASIEDVAQQEKSISESQCYGSGSGRAKVSHKKSKKLKNFCVLKCWKFSFES